MKNVVVTGGTGVMGNGLVRYLLKQGVHVTALVRPNSSLKHALPNDRGLLVIEGDLINCAHLADQFGRGYDYFFHLAIDGSLGDRYAHRAAVWLQHDNAVLTLNAVELCRAIGCPTFMMTGSQAEYGRYTAPVNEKCPFNPTTPYAISKHYACEMSRLLCAQYGINYILARLFSVYGCYDYSNGLIASSVRKLLAGEAPHYTQSEQIWDYLYTADAAKALYLLAKHGAHGEDYCVASGVARPLYEYINEMHKIVNPSIAPIFGAIPYAPDQVMCCAADITKLYRVTGFVPEYTFERGMEEIKAWQMATN